MSSIILGVVNNKEYRNKYNKKNERSKHFEDRACRVDLSLENSEPLYYYEVFRKKEGSNQVHCLYKDSALFVFNKKSAKIVTVILLTKNKLEVYLKASRETLVDYPGMLKCSKLHEKIKGEENNLTEIEILDIKERKLKYIQ